MKRWTMALAFAALAFSLTLASCDAMFESNVFAGMVKRDITASSVSDMTDDEVADLTKSQTAMQTLEDDAAAKQAVLDRLKTSFLDETGEVVAITAENAAAVQVAALAAGKVIVGTVPVAAEFSGGLVETVITMMTADDGSEFNIGDTLEELLPADISAAIDAGAAEPPAAFGTLVETFMAASDAYSALNASLDGQTLETTTLTSEEIVSAGINAVLAFAISNVELGADAGAYDLTTTEGVTALLWDQLTAEPTGTDPITGEETFPEIAAFPAFETVPPDLANILSLVGLDAVFGGASAE